MIFWMESRMKGSKEDLTSFTWVTTILAGPGYILITLPAMRHGSFFGKKAIQFHHFFNIHISPLAGCWWAGCWKACPVAGCQGALPGCLLMAWSWGLLLIGVFFVAPPLLQTHCLTLNWQKHDPHILNIHILNSPSSLSLKASLSSKIISKALWAENIFTILINWDKEPNRQSYLFVVPHPQFAAGIECEK